MHQNLEMQIYGCMKMAIFEKSFMSNHGLCEKGKYSLYDNEVWFRCGSHSSTAKIVSSFTDFKLKFIIGNEPEDDKNIIFEKVQN